MKNIDVKKVGCRLYHLSAKEGFLLESIATGKRYSEIQSCDLSRWRSVEDTEVQKVTAVRKVRKIAAFLRRTLRRMMEKMRFSKSKPKI